ncbi:MAG: imidazolonepropionase [Actinomycetales bacterium]|nr:imidazolonepropionase [Actinomycetales bacterium]
MSVSTERRTGSLVVDNIGELVTNDPTLGAGVLGIVRDAALLVVDGVVVYAGPRTGLPSSEVTGRIDAAGAAVLPGFVDSHGHLVFAGDRSEEFAARMAGEPYTAGGIASTVAATRAATDEQLSMGVARLVREAALSGTTTAECKSGYGLSVEDEARSLRIAGRHVEEVTFLGAHVVPADYADRVDDYVALVTGPMLDACAPYATWIDVFCDRGAFDGDQAREILRAGMARGLRPRIHANQLQHGPGVQVAVEVGAASADHVTHASDEDIEALASSDTVATLLPGAEFSTRAVYPDARRFLDAGVTVALAADCNPGSSYTTNMPFCIAVAVRDMRLTPAEAVWAATAGGARALRRTDVGHLGTGARADLVLLDAPTHVHLAYRPGVPLVRSVFRAGARVR